ncbi:MAG: GntR family transcriptional regulator [Nitriliruptoraceae bacterium]
MGIESMEPLRKEGTAVLIAKMLREQLADGRLEPGAAVGEAQLASQLEVSRAPVREALQRLAQEGLLDGQYHRRWTVVSIDDEDDVRDLYLARGVIERQAAELVAGRPPEAMIDALGRMREAAAVGDWDGISSADMQFHDALVEGSGSRRLMRMFSTLSVETSMCLRALKVTYGDDERIVTEHEEVLGALRDPDPSVGRDRIRLHLERSVERLVSIHTARAEA